MSEERLNGPEVLTGDEHPSPQFRREQWVSLNGTWDFHIDAVGLEAEPEAVSWESTIVVPFSPETKASGVGNTGFYTAVWYRKTFVAPELAAGERLVLHFEAVDYEAMVWVNGERVCIHKGGYTPFSADVTGQLRGVGEVQEIIVRAEDDPADLAKPRGKQDWRLEPHSIWYPRTTGIWQTVWLERVPSLHFESLQWSIKPRAVGDRAGCEDRSCSGA